MNSRRHHRRKPKRNRKTNWLNERDDDIAAYFNVDRLRKELYEFYKFTSDNYHGQIYTYEYDIIDDDTIDLDGAAYRFDSSPRKTSPMNKKKVITPTKNKIDKFAGLPSLSPISIQSSKSGSASAQINTARRDSHLKDISFQTNTTVGTDLDSLPGNSPLKALHMDTAISIADSQTPSSNATGVSYSSNTTISDLKVKKRQLERSFEKKFEQFPRIVELGVDGRPTSSLSRR